MKKAGFQNFADYITAPDKAPQPQPDPLKVKELQIKDKLADASVTQAQSAAHKNERLADIDAIKAQLDQVTTKFKQMMDLRESARMDAETQNRIDVSQREIALAEQDPGSDNIVVSPH